MPIIKGPVNPVYTGNLSLPSVSTLLSTPVAKSLTVSAIQVVVYDTNEDSDGGLWRKRCQHTSWYNESLNTSIRGSRREFPSVAIIVLKSDGIYIYDADDVTLPMWMVIPYLQNAETYWWGFGSSLPDPNCIDAKNGIIAFGNSHSGNSSTGLTLIRFINDNFYKYWYANNAYSGPSSINIANRSNTNRFYSNPSNGLLASRQVRSVSLTVLAGTPIDQATNIQIPTIAVATDEGVNIIYPDNSVGTIKPEANVAYNGSRYYPSVSWGPDGDLLMISHQSKNYGYQDWTYYRASTLPRGGVTISDDYHKVPNSISGAWDGPITDVTPAGNGGNQIGSWGGTGGLVGGTQYTTRQINKTAITEKEIVIGGGDGLDYIIKNTLSSGSGCESVRIQNNVNTGYVTGSARAVGLCETGKTGNLVATELVTDGAFEAAHNFTLIQGSATVSLDTAVVRSGVKSCKVTSTGGSNVYAGREITGLVVGKQYTFSVWYRGDTAHTTSLILNTQWANGGSVIAGSSGLNATTNWQQIQTVFVATTTSVWLNVFAQGILYIDDLTLRLCQTDYSAGGSGLAPVGIIAMNPVATGADMTGYGPFTQGSNWFEVNSTTKLQIGTSDYMFAVWVRPIDATFPDNYEHFMNIAEGAQSDTGNAHLKVWCSDLKPYMYCHGASQVMSNAALNNDGSWNLVVGGRSGGQYFLAVNGVLTWGNANTTAVGNYALRVGGCATTSEGCERHTLSMARFSIGKYIVTEAKMREWYEREKFIFQPNAKCTLYGTSSAVTALAYDEQLDRLHVGTSSGRSVFNGLIRVDNTTTAVTTSISAANGLVAEQ